jgi:hypothetical protein
MGLSINHDILRLLLPELEHTHTHTLSLCLSKKKVLVLSVGLSLSLSHTQTHTHSSSERQLIISPKEVFLPLSTEKKVLKTLN